MPGSLAWVRPLALGAILAAVGLGIRTWVAATPPFAEPPAGLARTGLLALAILRGETLPSPGPEASVLGVVDTYLGAVAFALLGPSTFALRLPAVGAAAVLVWALWRLARRTAGPAWGVLAGLLAAVPPVFLTHVQLGSPGSALALAAGAVALALAGRLLDGAAGRRELWTWGALGLAAGALPLWAGGVRHGWPTLVGGGVDPLAAWPALVEPVGRALGATRAGQSPDGGATDLPAAARAVEMALPWLVFALAGLIAVTGAIGWARRLRGRQRPLRDSLDLVVLVFWLALAAEWMRWPGRPGGLQDAAALYLPMPVLVATALARIARHGVGPRLVAIGLGALLIGHGLWTHAPFVGGARPRPAPVAALIARMDALGLGACYADGQIAPVITFQSAGRIVCADAREPGDATRWAAVEAVADPARVALVARRRQGTPRPEALAATLRLAGAGFGTAMVGDHALLHAWVAPDDRLVPLLADGWTVRASTRSHEAARVLDRRVWTRWRAPASRGAWLEVDLGARHWVAQVTLEPGPVRPSAPPGLRVETSLDGRRWDEGGEAGTLVTGLHFRNGRPHVDVTDRVTVRFGPRPARFVRLTRLDTDAGGVWSVGELFVDAAAEAPWRPPAPARSAVDEVEAVLARWAAAGRPASRPPPGAPPSGLGRPPWAVALERAGRALDLAPGWTEAHHAYARALVAAGWDPDAPDLAVARARAAGAWREVVRAAAAADADVPGLWRSGRAAARVEALERLGEADAAAAARREAQRALAVRRPVRSLEVVFGHDVALTGMELPEVVRAGEQAVLRVFWRALRPMRHDYWTVVHLTGPDGSRHDHDHRLGAGFGTSWWSPGEQVQEAFALAVPADLRPGRYEVRLDVLRPEVNRRLAVTRSTQPHGGHAALVGHLIVDR